MQQDSNFRRTPKIHLPDLLEGLLKRDRIVLARAITLIESKRLDDRKSASELMDLLLPYAGKSFKVGITGVPGVGKSTFIEAFGKHLTSKDLSVAVLSIDPSSSKTRGSILGDKTRMTALSTDPNAFIRPTAAGETLGGVASNTRETILLCEATGFDVILVETVGVGQSETMVRDMVDYFLLLMLAGGGDELQGIKRGIMELTDHVLINKSEGENEKKAKKAAEEYKNALHLFPPSESDWVVPVGLCSALEGSGISQTWEKIESFKKQSSANGWLAKNRKKQIIKWFRERIDSQLKEKFFSQPGMPEVIKKKEEEISSLHSSVRKAVDELFS